MLTTAVFAICITAPLGAIFINTLGTKWLTCDWPDGIKPTEAGADDENDPKARTVGQIVPEVLPETER
jgi:hypothetical protein